jgi:serine/threonine-protein kinase
MPESNVVAATTPATPEIVAMPPPKPDAAKPASQPPTPASASHDKSEKEISNSKHRTKKELMAGSQVIVSIAVTPWGEIYLDGKRQGVSPPLAELKVVPGKHTIEIRNTTFSAYSQSILAEAGKQVKIKHKFTN